MLALVYRYAPSRRKAHWRWVSPGAAIATGLWIVASALFTLYIVNFDRSARGRSCSAARSTRRWDGPSRPLGQRGARAADTVGSEH